MAPADQPPAAAQPAAQPGDDAPRAHATTAERAVVLGAQPVRSDLRAFEFGLQGGVFYGGNDWVADEAVYGGLGWLLRWRLSQFWSLAMGLDLSTRTADNADYSEMRVSFDIGTHFYFLESRTWQPYLSLGLVMASATVTNQDAFVHNETEYSELGGFVGGGLDVLLGGDWMLTTGLRVLALGRGDDSSPRPGVDYTRRADDGRGLLQWTFGAGYRF